MKINKKNVFETLEVKNIENQIPKIRLNNLMTNNSVELIGVYLEAQYIVNDNYLLFITMDCPFEESLFIYLLDNQLKIKDTVELGVEFNPGFFRNPVITGLDTINFSFFEEGDSWLLTILDKPKISLFNFEFPVKRKRIFLNKNWLKLKRSI